VGHHVSLLPHSKRGGVARGGKWDKCGRGLRGQGNPQKNDSGIPPPSGSRSGLLSQYTTMANQIVIFEKDICRKIYDIDNPAEGTFSCMTQAQKFVNEVTIYRILEGTNVTPKLMDVGPNFLCLEKFDWTLSEALETGRCHKEDLKELMRRYVKPLCEKLDEMRIFHDDPSLNNVVCNTTLTKFAIIDFETADILSKDDEIPSNFSGFIDF
jgi:hypothetical protein